MNNNTNLCPYRNICVSSLQDEEECNKYITDYTKCKYYILEKEDYAHIIHQYEIWYKPRRKL